MVSRKGKTMGSFICRQPNGLLCRFSTIIDTVTHYNMTDEEYIHMKMEQAREEAEDVLKNHIKPYEWIDQYFETTNMSQEEFDRLKQEMCKAKEQVEEFKGCANCRYLTCEGYCRKCKNHSGWESIGVYPSVNNIRQQILKKDWEM